MSYQPRVGSKKGSKAEGSTAATRQLYGGVYGYPLGDVASLGLLGGPYPWLTPPPPTTSTTQDKTQMTHAGGMMTLKQLMQLMQPASTLSKDTGTNYEAAVNLKHSTNAVRFKVEMPGFNKDNVKVYLEGANLVVNGVRKVDPEFDDDCEKDDTTKTFSTKVDVSSVLYISEMDDISAVMTDGILKVTIPKIKHEDRADVVHVQVK